MNSKVNRNSSNQNSSFLNNKNRNILKDQSKENRNYKNIINTRGKLLLINNCDLININNYFTNNENNSKVKKIKTEEEINQSDNNNKNVNGSYILITLNNNNNLKKTTSVERKNNIIVNKLGISNIVNINNYNNYTNNFYTIKEKNGINSIKKRRRDLSAKERQDYFNFNFNLNKKYYQKENHQNSLNLKKKP